MTFFIITLLVVIHEIGHFLMALYLGVEVKKIYIYPFGGVSKFNMNYNIKLFDEFLILISGPIMQIIFTFVLINLSFFYNYNDMIISYSLSLLVFNLLPVYPLDGGKLLNIIFNYFTSFYKSIYYSLYIGLFISVLFLLLYMYSGINNLFIIFVFFLYKISLEYLKINFILQRFYIERYMSKYKFNKRIIVNNEKEFRKNKTHLIYKKGRYYTEKEYFKSKYL